MFNAIENAHHIVLIAHINPDADSLGSASAMYTHLMRLEKKVTLFCVSEQINPRLAFLPWFDKMRHQFPKSADLAISFDCGAYKRLGVEVTCDVINIDHHKSNEAYGTINVIDTTAISTTQVLFDLFHKHDIKINPKIATALYAGLLDDSHGFLSPKSDARSFQMAAALTEAKADISACAQALFHQNSLAALRLKGMMFEQMQLLFDARVVVHLVTKEMMAKSGGREVDCEAALEESMGLPHVELGLMVRENRNGTIKGSLRSVGELDVEQIARKFGGGGHKHAAGLDVKDSPIDAVYQKLLSVIKEEV
ncbi:MAG: DHH family phosphoesterase [Helicobacteraceae bacterium]|nr:DHH family phosphoesterase [Helicobacteraceae bacterium]